MQLTLLALLNKTVSTFVGVPFGVQFVVVPQFPGPGPGGFQVYVAISYDVNDENLVLGYVQRFQLDVVNIEPDLLQMVCPAELFMFIAPM